ncbi:hypothetical protein LJPFL01_0847 [Lelliottia jeotgali]|nr:hypothetical protein LJPFL01_0847 [Lelliottia jeotgali]
MMNNKRSVPDSVESEKLKPCKSSGVLIIRACENLNNVNQVVIIL